MNKWSIPKEVNNLDLGFGPNNLNAYLPTWEEIPQEFKTSDMRGRGEAAKWVKIVDDWFFSGLQNLVAIPKAGIDKNIAMRHIVTILHSFDPPHEHKTAGVAWLLSQWFDVFDYQVEKKEYEK